MFLPPVKRSLLHRFWYLFIALALLGRAVYVNFQLEEYGWKETPGRLSLELGDTKDYLGPIENLLRSGTYAPDYRMPGVGAPYWVFRQFLDVGGSRDAMIILQWLFSALAVYLLARLAYRLSGSIHVALWTYALFLVSTMSSWFDATISSDSLAASVIVTQAFVFQQAFDRNSRALLLLAGLLLTWIYFLRPVACLLVIPAIVLVWMKWKERPTWRACAWMLLPVLIIETAWVVRNWRVYGEFNPLTNQGIMPDEITKNVRGHAMDFVRAFGGNYIWWEPGSEIRWLGEWYGSPQVDDEGRRAKEPPPDAYVPGYTKDSLLMVAERIRAVRHGDLSTADSLAACAWAMERLDRYTEMHRRSAPLSHHVLSRGRMLRYLLWQSGSELLFPKPFHALPIWKKGFKLVQVSLYLFAISFGAIAIMLHLWRWRRANTILATWVPTVALYMMLIYPLGVKMAEHRWVSHIFPFWLMMAVIGAYELIRSIRDHTSTDGPHTDVGLPGSVGVRAGQV